MESDPAGRHYKKKRVERLSRAASEHLAQSSDANAFVIANPMRQRHR
jgi:hypothetical protein